MTRSDYSCCPDNNQEVVNKIKLVGQVARVTNRYSMADVESYTDVCAYMSIS